MRFKFVVWAVLCAVALRAGEVTPASAASFDCAKASTRIEKMICQDDGLSRLDDQMADNYKAQLAAQPNDPSVREAQARWLQERNKCADESCLRIAYVDRLSALILGLKPAAPPPAIADADLLETYREFNGRCRGGSGDNPATWQACNERDRLGKELEARDWCYGPKSVPGYQQKWHRCLSEYDKSNWFLIEGPKNVKIAIDLSSITKLTLGGGRNGVVADFHGGVDGVVFRLRATFDCNGNFQMISPKYEPETALNSPLIRQISEVVCYQGFQK